MAQPKLPTRKRLFDLAIIFTTVWIWLPLQGIAAMALLATNGMPVLYRSRRRVFRDQSASIVKFRTMVRNAEQLFNRDTVPIRDTRFLNLPITSRCYTRTGRWVERFMFTELPQFWQVLSGTLTLVGNRPLPENVISALDSDFVGVAGRFEIPCGLTGPVQLVNRERIADRDRLNVECAYAKACELNYSFRLDFLILLYTVLIGFHLKPLYDAPQALALIEKYTGLRWDEETVKPRIQASNYGPHYVSRASTSEFLDAAGEPSVTRVP